MPQITIINIVIYKEMLFHILRLMWIIQVYQETNRKTLFLSHVVLKNVVFDLYPFRLFSSRRLVLRVRLVVFELFTQFDKFYKVSCHWILAKNNELIFLLKLSNCHTYDDYILGDKGWFLWILVSCIMKPLTTPAVTRYWNLLTF